MNFNDNFVKQAQFKKNLSACLDDKLDFRKHLQNMFKKVSKTISLLHKLQNNLPRASLVTIYLLFIRPHLDYFNNPFLERLESIQYNALLAITGAMRGSSRKKTLSGTRF